MSTTEQPDSALVAHNELDIPGRTGPVSDGPPPVWGINRAAALDNFPQQGLLCRAGPWGQMNAGDKVNIYRDTGQLLLPKTVQPHEVNSQLQMFIAPQHLVEGTFAVSYTITRLNQAPEPSEVMQVQVKLTRPGGHDDTEEPGHPHLLMSIPKEILEGGVHSENVDKGVEITIGEGNGAPPYPNAAPGDRMRITWGGVFVNSDALSQEQAEGKAPIVVTIAAKTITDAGDSDAAGLAVAFEVYDVVQNRSEDWSAEQRVVVAVSTTLLGAPLLKEAQNNVLDIDLLGDADGTAQIIAADANFKVGDTPVLRIKSTPHEGQPIDMEIHGEPLVSVPSIPEIKIRNAILRPLAKTQIALSYRLQKADGSPDKPAKTQFISAIGEIERLAAPVALDAVQGALDPQLDQVRVLIPWHASFKAGDAIKTFYLGTPPSTIPYLPDLPLRSITQGDIDQAEDLLIIIDKAHLAPINGGTLVLYYQLLIEDAVLAQMDELGRINAVRESIRSETLLVGEPRQELPAPEVAGVVDGVLPPDTNGTTLTVTYLDTVAGDEVTYQWIGSKTGETTDSVVLTSFTAGKPVQFTIRAEFIKGNEGGTVSAKYEIKRVSGKTSYSNALDFSVGVALDLKEPEIKQANGTSLDPLDAQSALTAVIDYVGMLIDDKITVTWAAAAGTPADGSHTTAPWPVATVGPQEIPLLQLVVAFNLGKPVTVSYTVSRGSGEPVPSRPLTLTVLSLQQKDLPRPEIDGMPGEMLDVHTLIDTASTRIAKWPLIALGQKLWLYYAGTKADNSPYSSQTYNATPVPSAGLPNGMYPNAPVVDLRGLKDGSELKIEFKVTFDKDTTEATAQTFPVRTYTIKSVDLAAPRIKEANGNSLDPFAARDALTAVIPAYPDMIGTQVSVTWTGTPGEGSVTVGPVNVTAQMDKEITLPNTVVAFNLGKQVSVTYTVICNSVPQGSDELLLGVLPITDGDARLGMPLIIEAADSGNGSTLDISALTTNATMRVNSYPFIALEQYVWLRVTGTRNDTNGSEYAKTFWQPPGSKTNSTWISQGFQTRTISLADLKSLRNGSDLKMEFKTGLGGSADENVATTLKERVYTIKAEPALEWDNRPVTFAIKTVSVEGAKPDWADTGLLQSKYINRPPSGGVSPYTYTSSDEGVAIATRGQIASVRPGRCVITLQDEAGTTKTLEVTVSATEYKLLYSPTLGTLAEFEAWAEQVGGTSRVPNEFMDVFVNQFYARQNESFHLTIEPFQNGQNQCMNAGPSLWTYRVVSAKEKLQFLTIKR